jgi:hypothetical protein
MVNESPAERVEHQREPAESGRHQLQAPRARREDRGSLILLPALEALAGDSVPQPICCTMPSNDDGAPVMPPTDLGWRVHESQSDEELIEVVNASLPCQSRRPFSSVGSGGWPEDGPARRRRSGMSSRIKRSSTHPGFTGIVAAVQPRRKLPPCFLRALATNRDRLFHGRAPWHTFGLPYRSPSCCAKEQR